MATVKRPRSTSSTTGRAPRTATARRVAALQSAMDTLLFKALGEPARQHILLILLREGRANVQDVAQHLVQDRSVVSRHLATLEQAGCLRSARVQRYTEYEVDTPALVRKLERMLTALRQCLPGK